MALYNSVIHYQNNGKLEDIDNRLLYDENTKNYENKNNDFKIKFPKNLKENKKIKLTKGKHQIDWSVLNINSSGIYYLKNDPKPNNIKELPFVNQSIVYRGIQKFVDLEYVLSGNDIKENIILNEYKPSYSISFIYKLKNLNLEVDNHGNYVFLNESNEIVFNLNSLFMIDKNNNISENVLLDVIKTSKDTYKVTITPNDDWLKGANYPVTIDPSISSVNNNITIYDTYISEQCFTAVIFPNSSYMYS